MNLRNVPHIALAYVLSLSLARCSHAHYYSYLKMCVMRERVSKKNIFRVELLQPVLASEMMEKLVVLNQRQSTQWSWWESKKKEEEEEEEKLIILE